MSSMLSEVETMDNTLPFVGGSDSNTASEKTRSGVSDEDFKPKIAAPTIEEVDEDPETLRSLRGQGRYFGVDSDDKDGIKEAVPKCRNCSQRGHLKKNCPHVICTYCGAMDDHYSKHCPKAIKCANCNESGHYRSQCPHKWKRVFCAVCNSKRHSRDRCPSIWRVYLLKEDNGKTQKNKKNVPFEKIYCYNCGSVGHFGDDCDQRRSSRVPNDDGSAFSGDNLSNILKKQYYDQLDNLNDSYYNKNKSSRASLYDDYNNVNNNNDNRDDFNYDDYEFDDSYYDSNNKSKKSKKRKRTDNYNSGNNFNNSNDTYNANNKRNRQPQPTYRGKSFPNNTQSYSNNNNNNNSRSHSLDFPRSSRNSNIISQDIQSSRYGSSSSSSYRGNYNNQQSNYKNYNSYKPFRSGVLRKSNR